MSYDKKRIINGFNKIIDQRSLDSMNSNLKFFLESVYKVKVSRMVQGKKRVPNENKP